MTFQRSIQLCADPLLLARKIILEIPPNQGQLFAFPPILLLVLLSESFNSPPQMPPIVRKALRMELFRRSGRHQSFRPIKVLRGKHWRYMKRRLENFAKAYKKEYGGDVSGRLIWREGNRKHQVEQPWGVAGARVCSAPDSL